MNRTHITDREYYDVLRQRALLIISQMEKALSGRELDNEDGRFAPHVCAERMLQVADMAKTLQTLADALK